MLELFSHIFFNALHRHMAWAFNHHLNVVLPGLGSKLTQGMQFTKLRCVIGISNATWPQSITQAKGHVIRLHDLANFIELGVEEILFVVG